MHYDLARRLDLTPMRNSALRMVQAHQQISPNLASSQRAALAAWLEEYPDRLGCPDRLHYDGRFSARFGPGLRPLSGAAPRLGDPVEWGEGYRPLQKLGIGPLSKCWYFPIIST